MSEEVDGYKIYTDPKNLLGVGTFGQVYNGKEVRSSKKVAVKKIFLNRDPEFMKYIDREQNALKAVSHPNITKLYHIAKYELVIYFFIELCNMDLNEFVKKASSLPKGTYLTFMHEIAKAVQHMHHLTPALIHRDIKPGNILVKIHERSPLIKLADFGLARSISMEETQVSATACGTFNYMSPEIYPDERGRVKYGPPVDIFSMGLIFLALVEGRPGQALKSMKVNGEPLGKVMFDKMKRREPIDPPVPIDTSDDAITTKVKMLVAQMLCHNSKQRVNISAVCDRLDYIINHPESPGTWTKFPSLDNPQANLTSLNIPDAFDFLVPARGSLKRTITDLIRRTWDDDHAHCTCGGCYHLHSIKLDEVVEVWHIENPALWCDYITNLRPYFENSEKEPFRDITSFGPEVQTAGISSLDKDRKKEMNEYFFFHGTQEEAVRPIILQNLDIRLGDKDARYGKAIYLSEHSSLAHGYSEREFESPHRYMFIVRAPLGRLHYIDEENQPLCSICHHKVCTHNAPLDATQDSIVIQRKVDGQIFREFVLFRNSVTYPEYLIKYNANGT